MTNYTLMHKNISGLSFSMDETTGTITHIESIYDEKHVPVGIPIKNGNVDRAALNQWWTGRAIPASRMDIDRVLWDLQMPGTSLLLEKCMGLSLSDQYWIRLANSEVKWEQVNFFQNSFSEDMGDLLFGSKSPDQDFDLMSPDNTSDGWLKKKWKIVGGKRCLIKGGSGATQQEPYNEIFASRLMERLGIEHVPYSLLVEEGYPYSICEDFVTLEIELISAWHIMQSYKKPNHLSWYQHFLNCCTALEIPNIQAAMDRMIVLDYLIANEDRHQNNFGVIRNAETLQYLGAAPIYDSGTSLWFNKPKTMINNQTKISCKPFKSNHEEQLKLVKSFDWLDFTALQDIEEEFREIVNGSLFIDEERCGAICAAIKERVKKLKDFVDTRSKSGLQDDVCFDVTEDVAYNGSN